MVFICNLPLLHSARGSLGKNHKHFSEQSQGELVPTGIHLRRESASWLLLSLGESGAVCGNASQPPLPAATQLGNKPQA